MAQYDLLLTQNIAVSGIEFSEKYINIAKGGLLSANASGNPTVLAKGANGYMLVVDDTETSGLKWQAIPSGHTQNTDTGTTSGTFQLDSGNSGPKIRAIEGGLGIRNAADSAYVNLQADIGSFNKVVVADAPTVGTHAANKTYVDGLLSANDAMIFKGTLGSGGTYTTLPTTHGVGWTIKVITAGTYAGKVAEIGDMYISLVTRAGSGNVNGDWAVIQANIDGAVTGPASATSDAIALFDGVSGKVIKNSSKTLANLVEKSGNLTNNAMVVGASASEIKHLATSAQTVILSVVANTPTGVVIPASNFVGRKATGDLGPVTAAEARTILNVADGANAYTHPSDGGGSIPTALIGANVISQLVVNTAGHVTGTATRALTLSDLGAMNNWVTAPASKTATGTIGHIAFDANYVYICTATNTWKRIPLATNWEISGG